MGTHSPSTRRQAAAYDYFQEPVDERPSEFAPSTSYSTLLGCDRVSPAERRRHARQPRFGAKSLLLSVIVLVGASAAAVHWMAQLLRH